MSNSCIYHFQELLGYCKKCRFFICTPCLTQHLNHLGDLIIMKNIQQKLKSFYQEIKLLNVEKQNNINVLKNMIMQSKTKITGFLKNIQDQIIKEQETHHKVSSTYKYLKLLNYLKNGEYNLLENIDFEKIHDSIQKNKLGEIKEQNDKQSLRINKLVQVNIGLLNELLQFVNDKKQKQSVSDTFQLAQKEYNSKNYQKSCNLFKKGLSQIQKYELKYKKYYQKFGECVKKLNKNDEAQKIYKRLLLMDPLNKDYNYNMGNVQYTNNRYVMCLEYLKQAQNLDNNSVKIYEMKAQCYQKLNQNQKCLEVIQKLIKYNPNDSNYQNKKTNIVKKINDCKKIQKSSMEKNSLNNQDLSLLILNARRYQQAKKYQKALENYNKIVQIKPKQSLYHFSKGKIEFILQKYQNSVVSFSNAIKYTPNSSQYHYQKFKALFQLKQYQLALVEIQKTLQINNNNPTYYLQQGQTYEALNNLEKALQSYEKCIKVKQDNAQAWFRKAQILKLQQKYEDALSCYEKAIKISPQKQYIQQRDKIKGMSKKKKCF